MVHTGAQRSTKGLWYCRARVEEVSIRFQGLFGSPRRWKGMTTTWHAKINSSRVYSRFEAVYKNASRIYQGNTLGIRISKLRLWSYGQRRKAANWRWMASSSSFRGVFPLLGLERNFRGLSEVYCFSGSNPCDGFISCCSAQLIGEVVEVVLSHMHRSTSDSHLLSFRCWWV